MKIALIGYEANIKNRVGSNQYAFELLKALYQLDEKNQYTVFLPTPPLSDLPCSRANWQYKVVRPSKFWNLWALPWALWQAKPKPDVVFVPGHYAPLFCPAPLVISIMDLGYLRFPEHFTKRIYWQLKLWTALSLKKAKHILTISQASKDDIIKYYGFEPKRITVAYPGYDRGKFKIRDKGKIGAILKKYGIPGEYLLFLSTLKPSKNIEGLLKAFQKLKEKNLSLVIAGKKGWLFENIFSQVEELGLKDRVIFTDFVTEEEVPDLMAGAKAFVLPSFWEGFGIPVVEAMACGTPVVVANAGSLPEIIGEAGVVVDPYKPESITKGIEEAINKKEELIKKGFKQVEKFNWQNCAQKILEVLKDVQR
ncbi:glycosyltransferase family 4 protein [Candidatus Shapirobacteria bacterium]|nr:glycosyltransferase family 4 protein [Candidatus Shapirobacteria bacterium]